MSGFVIIVFLVVIFLILKICLSILKGSMKIFRMGRSNTNARQDSRRYQDSRNSTDNPNPQKKFSKDEGKYIDYEEIKEEG